METAKNQKKILILILLLFSLLVLNLIIFKPLKSPTQQGTNPKDNQDFFEFSALLANSSAKDIAQLMGAKNLLPVIKELKLSNNISSYYSRLSEPIIIDSGFRLLLNFTEQNTDSQIIISGRENLHNNKWWENIYQLRLGYSNENKGLVISLLNGQKPKSIYYQAFEDLKRNDSFILEFSDKYGSSLVLKTLSGQVLADINFLKKKYQMPAGLFPYQSMQIGVNLTPNIGKLTINKFYLYELR